MDGWLNRFDPYTSAWGRIRRSGVFEFLVLAGRSEPKLAGDSDCNCFVFDDIEKMRIKKFGSVSV